MRLYYHKTDGGAEYLTDAYIQCDYCDACEMETPNDGSLNCSCGAEKHREGIFEGARYVVRIDGDITRDAELTDRDNIATN